MVRVWPLRTAALLCALATSAIWSPARAASGAHRVKLVPHFAPGQVLRYQFDLRTNTTSHSTGPIVDPEGATRLELSATATVRLEVLSVEGATADSAGRVRLRATFEKSAVSSGSDALDPQQVAKNDKFRKLQGSSVEFTLEPDGRVSDLAGESKDALADASLTNSVREGLVNVSPGASLPQRGISIGEKWSAERPFASTPLAGLAWRTESTYLRDEPCRPVASAKPGAAAAAGATEMCAVILTRFRIIEHGHGDRTPDDYRKNGLRTSGKWNGSLESLTSIGLQTGLVNSVTQTGTEEMDFTVSSVTGRSRMHYVGKVHRQSEITLLPEPSP